MWYDSSAIKLSILRDETEWVEILENHWNQVVRTNKDSLAEAFARVVNGSILNKVQENFYGNGDAVDKILKILGDVI
jgi:UDP-N-acetylglucosamine 2-epimerase